MRKNLFLFMLIALSFTFMDMDCTKKNDGVNPVSTVAASEVFWVSSSDAVFPVTVTVVSKASNLIIASGKIKYMLTQTTAASLYCDKSGDSSLALSGGRLDFDSFTAYDAGGHSWYGHFYMPDGGYCHHYELKK